MASGGPETAEIKLRRHDSGLTWGFRMQGGVDTGIPVFVDDVEPKSVSEKAGLRVGDVLLRIGRADALKMTYYGAKSEFLRAGNDVDLIVQRNALNPSDPGIQAQVARDDRSEVVEEKTPTMGGGQVYQPIEEVGKTKTFSVLKKELPQSQAGGSKPSSIFDRKKQERSSYLQAKGTSFQKCYGES